jgi:CysZ protein
MRELGLAIGDVFRPEQLRAILLSLVLALLLLAGMWLGVAFLLRDAHLAGLPLIDGAIAALGSIATMTLCWLLYPAMTLLMLGFFLDRVVAAVERRHYPFLPPARSLSAVGALFGTLRLLALALILNLLALPLYLVPGINLFVYYTLNGYLVGREYFELVALRRLDTAATRALWRWHRGRLVLAGVIIVFLLSLPVINLVTPVFGAAFMLHLFQTLRDQRRPADFSAGARTGLMED